MTEIRTTTQVIEIGQRNQSKRQTDIKAAAIDIEITYLDIELQTF